jgi:hypothetical protein
MVMALSAVPSWKTMACCSVHLSPAAEVSHTWVEGTFAVHDASKKSDDANNSFLIFNNKNYKQFNQKLPNIFYLRQLRQLARQSTPCRAQGL